ncbi:hypothetical protein Tco_0267083 [Tanacetum coccineum]
MIELSMSRMLNKDYLEILRAHGNLESETDKSLMHLAGSQPMLQPSKRSRVTIVGCAEMEVVTWDDHAFKLIILRWNVKHSTDIAKISRKRLKSGKYEHGNGRAHKELGECYQKPTMVNSKLHQLDTFYNALNANDQDSLNSVAGGNFLDKMPRECLRIIESKSKVRNSRNKAVVVKVSSNSSTPGISPDVAHALNNRSI